MAEENELTPEEYDKLADFCMATGVFGIIFHARMASEKIKRTRWWME